jgi:hypothetical protein
MFLGRLASYASAIAQEHPITGEIPSVNVPTGATWSLSTLLPVDKTGEVTGGYYVWNGSTTFERFLAVDTADVKKYSYRSRPGPTYVMLKEPIFMSPPEFAMLQSIPPTPPREAVHPVPDRPQYMYRPGIPKDCGKKEKFTLEGGDEDQCDMFSSFENMPPKGPTIASIVSWASAVIALLMMTLGIYVGLRTVLDPEKGNIVANWGVRTRNWLLETADRVSQ